MNRVGTSVGSAAFTRNLMNGRVNLYVHHNTYVSLTEVLGCNVQSLWLLKTSLMEINA